MFIFLTASQQIPRFIQEITDTYVGSGQRVVFETSYSGTPAPGNIYFAEL